MLALLLLLSCAQEPLAARLPRHDLGVTEFLAAHPEYDGRGIRVAVLDTGVDPGHPLLQSTPDGRRKLVACYDATTDGRVDTGYEVASDDGTLLGLTGRRLELGRWHAPGRSYHLGRIGSEFLPDELRHRILAERRERWREEKRRFEEERARDGDTEPDDPTETARLAELERRFASFDDPGPAWDVVTFRDDDGWKVVVDDDEDGDLDEEPALRPFGPSGDWTTLGDEAFLNYAVDVLDDGDVTLLLFDTHGHGTHVAGIIGAWDPDGALSGVAPGVEIVSIKIGDGKFGGSTSGFAIAKALDLAVEAGCQIANMSFGGPAFFADGDEPEAVAVREAAKRGLFLVTSAGNEGPTLSTVGSPATVTEALSVAAAVWPGTQVANYASLEPAGPVLFDFSSRGPLPSGSLGIDFAAPGAALSTLPSWRLVPGQNWNGTSMAAPQMAGCLALLESAALAEGLPTERRTLERALRLSARPLAGFAWVEQGHGAVWLPDALDALARLAAADWRPVDWRVEVQNAFGVGAGIYLRGLPPDGRLDRGVTLRARFRPEEHASSSRFLRTLRLQPEAAWVEAPRLVNVVGGDPTGFRVRLDVSDLPPGLHSTRVLLWDVDLPESLGPELVLPVTVVVPEHADDEGRFETEFHLAPGELHRTFLEVPFGARFAHVELTQSGGGRNEVRTGAGSVSGFRYAGDRQKRGRFFLRPGDTITQDVPVEPGTVWEFTAAARWSSNLPADYRLTVRFDGLEPQHERWRIPAGQELGYLALMSPLRDASVRLEARVAGVAEPVLEDWDVVPDPIRPVVFDDLGMFQGVVEHPFQVPEDGVAVVLHMPASIQTIELREDLMVEVFDANGMVVARSIAYEVDTDLGRLDAGDYVLRLAYPTLGRRPLDARFAGAELRLAHGGGGLTLYPGLQSYFGDAPAASSSVFVPRRGVRTVVAELPELDALTAGRRWYGELTCKVDGAVALRVPLQVDRPAPDATADAGSGEADAADQGADQGADEAVEPPAWRVTLDDPAAPAADRIAAARDWWQAEPRNPEAALTVIRELHAAGLDGFVDPIARDFLRRYPRAEEDFLAVMRSTR